jgi:Cu/Ag efflux pump CusA
MHGISPRDALSVLRATYGGLPLGTVMSEAYPLPLILALPTSARTEFINQNIPIAALDGHLQSLGDVMQSVVRDGRYNIFHRNNQRVQTITANVSDRPLSEYWAELNSRLANELKLPPTMRVELTGAAVEQATAQNQLIVNSLLAGAGVLALVAVALGSMRHVLIVLLNLPFALIGGVLAVLVTHSTLSIGSVVGFVTLFGITVRNSIMLVAHYTHLVTHEGCNWTLDTVARGAAERLPSIVMTALVTALAMLPIALNSDNAGREIMGPMAAIIIGGLVSSAGLNLLIMPALMWRFGRFNQPINGA